MKIPAKLSPQEKKIERDLYKCNFITKGIFSMFYSASVCIKNKYNPRTIHTHVGEIIDLAVHVITLLSITVASLFRSLLGEAIFEANIFSPL